MYIMKKCLFLLGCFLYSSFLMQAQSVKGSAEVLSACYVGRFLCGSGPYALIAQSLQPERWSGKDAYFLSDILIVNTANGKDRHLLPKGTYTPVAAFSGTKGVLYSDGSSVYRCKLGGGKAKKVYTVSVPDKIIVLDLVHFGDMDYVVLEDYAEKIFDRYEMSEDENYYHCYLKIIALDKENTEVARISFPSTEWPRYECLDKEGRWVFRAMDTVYVMDVPGHIQDVQFPMEKKYRPDTFDNSCFSVRPSSENEKEIVVKTK